MSGGQDQAAEAINAGRPDLIAELQKDPNPLRIQAWEDSRGRRTELPMYFVEKAVAEYLSPLRHQIASLQVYQAIIRAKMDSMDGRLTTVEKMLPKANENPGVERMTLGPPVQFKLGDQWKVGQVVVAAEDVESWACQRDPFRIIVSCLDGMWLVPAEMLETKPLRTD